MTTATSAVTLAEVLTAPLLLPIYTPDPCGAGDAGAGPPMRELAAMRRRVKRFHYRNGKLGELRDHLAHFAWPDAEQPIHRDDRRHAYEQLVSTFRSVLYFHDRDERTAAPGLRDAVQSLPTLSYGQVFAIAAAWSDAVAKTCPRSRRLHPAADYTPNAWTPQYPEAIP